VPSGWTATLLGGGQPVAAAKPAPDASVSSIACPSIHHAVNATPLLAPLPSLKGSVQTFENHASSHRALARINLPDRMPSSGSVSFRCRRRCSDAIRFGDKMSHTVAVTDNKLRNSSALEYVAGRLRLPRYSLPCMKITGRERSFRWTSLAEANASAPDFGKRKACRITSILSHDFGAVFKPRRSDHV
jgi:hypothetical protein